MIPRPRGREKLRQEVRGLRERPIFMLPPSLFALLFAYVCVCVCLCPLASLAEGRRPDRRDEAGRATLVSFPEHHPSPWELSA